MAKRSLSPAGARKGANPETGTELDILSQVYTATRPPHKTRIYSRDYRRAEMLRMIAHADDIHISDVAIDMAYAILHLEIE